MDVIRQTEKQKNVNKSTEKVATEVSERVLVDANGAMLKTHIIAHYCTLLPNSLTKIHINY